VPQVAAITQAGRRLRGARTLDGPDAIAAFLRDPANFPLFAKPGWKELRTNVSRVMKCAACAGRHRGWSRKRSRAALLAGGPLLHLSVLRIRLFRLGRLLASSTSVSILSWIMRRARKLASVSVSA